jgi:succinate dehydrogenase / fumarate reductase flavoprotein subunit
MKNGVYLDFAEAIGRLGRDTIETRYGNLFEMYERITDENPYEVPMRIYPAPHYTMGGLWVDYDLMTSIPGLYTIGEANFSDHGANRLGASALMQGLADGYFILPNTIAAYLSESLGTHPMSTDDPAFKQTEADVTDRTERLLGSNGSRTVDWFHRELGKIVWEHCGMARSAEGLTKAISEIPALKREFFADVKIMGEGDSLNQTLEKAGRVADYFDLAELMCRDALHREESCGGHFRVEHVTDDGEAKRNDEEFTFVSAWGFEGDGAEPSLTKEILEFENVELTTRSYK